MELLELIDQSNIVPHLISGNGAHPCSFGMAVFFMLPLSILGIILCKQFYVRVCYFIMAVIIVASHFLQVQATVSIGWILLAIAFIPEVINSLSSENGNEHPENNVSMSITAIILFKLIHHSSIFAYSLSK